MPADPAGIVVRPAGDAAVLLEVAGSDEALGLAAAVRARLGDRVLDVVPGHRTVLVRWEGGRPAPCADWAALAEAVPPRVAAGAADVVLDVTYDGPDLEAVARATCLGTEEVVRRHRAATYRVAFVGFAPGFAYMIGGDPALHLPRRGQPRDRVAAGSVAIAGPYCAVYPGSSPGGWHLLGRTEAVLFDPERDPPALLAPGTTVRFT